MKVVELKEVIRNFFIDVLETDCRVLSITKTEEGWRAVSEVKVDEDYTRRKGIGDVVEIFEVTLNEKSEITGYELKKTKKKVSID